MLQDNGDGKYPLIIACANSQEDIVKLLVSHGAEVNVVGTKGASPLLLAAAKGNLENVKVSIEK